MAPMEILETCFVERGDSKTITFADDWYALNLNQGQTEFVTPVFHNGELKLLKQFYPAALVQILRRNELLERGKEIEIRRTDDERGDYEVSWLEDGEAQSDEEQVAEVGSIPAGALGS